MNIPRCTWRLELPVLIASLLLVRLVNADEPPAAAAPSGALKAYVEKEDKSYRWVKRREGKIGHVDYVELTLTSQTWKEIVWKHQLFILRPAHVASAAQAMLMISGGVWKPELEQPPAAGEKFRDVVTQAAMLAEQTQAPVAVLLQVPEQPLFDGLTEDRLISMTFVEFFATDDPQWLALLPMVKSAVRGMDAVQEFCRQNWSLDVRHFTVTGASKRGWTTWLTAAVDPRVNSLAPMVIDMLNMEPQLRHQEESFGKPSEQLRDYTEKGVQLFLSTPRGHELISIVDPYSYRQAIRQPKLILLGTNDRYWPLDSLNLYWDGLQGEKHVLYVPNCGHDLRDYGRVEGALCGLFREAAGDKPLPKLSFQYADRDGRTTLAMQSDMQPREVHVWTATSATRDFRESRWESHPAKADGSGFTYEMPPPARGFAALFGEAVYPGDGVPLYLSTLVRIVAAK